MNLSNNEYNENNDKNNNPYLNMIYFNNINPGYNSNHSSNNIYNNSNII